MECRNRGADAEAYLESRRDVDKNPEGSHAYGPQGVLPQAGTHLGTDFSR